MNLYALLYETLIVNDSWLLTNAALQEILSARDGVELLRSRVIIPARRDTAATFAEVHAQARAKNMYGLTATDAFTGFLDVAVPAPIIFSMKEVAAAYVAMSGRVLERDVLIRLGVPEADAEKAVRIIADAVAKGVPTTTNTFVKDVICPQLDAAAAGLVMEAARAPYALNLPANVLKSGIVGPEGFRGDAILAVLRGGVREVGTLGVVPGSSLADGAFRATVGDALVNWLLGPEVLERLTAEELAAARGSSHRGVYLAALQIFLGAPSQVAWDALAGSLGKYLRTAADDVFRMWMRAGKIGVGPMEGELVVEGAQTIRIRTPGTPVELSGIAGATPDAVLEVEPVKVLGKTLAVPVAPHDAVI